MKKIVLIFLFLGNYLWSSAQGNTSLERTGNWFAGIHMGALAFFAEGYGDKSMGDITSFSMGFTGGNWTKSWMCLRVKGAYNSLNGYEEGNKDKNYRGFLLHTDVMFGMFDLLGGRPGNRFEVLPFVGLGGFFGGTSSYALIGGVQLLYSLTEVIDLDMEWQAAVYNDKFVEKGGLGHDGAMTLSLGISYRF